MLTLAQLDPPPEPDLKVAGDILNCPQPVGYDPRFDRPEHGGVGIVAPSAVAEFQRRTSLLNERNT
jgi:hypothetical protein